MRPRYLAAEATLLLAVATGATAAVLSALALIGLAPTPWGWVNVVLALGFGVAASLLLSARTRQAESIFSAFGIETVETIASLGLLRWRTRRTTGVVTRASAGHAVRAVAPLLGLGLACALILGATHRSWHGRMDAFTQSIGDKGWPTSLAKLHDGRPDSDYVYPGLEQAYAGLDLEPWNAGSKDRRSDVRRWDKKEYRSRAADVDRYEPFLIRRVAPLLRNRSRFFKTDYAEAARNPLGAPIPMFGRAVLAARMARLCAEARSYRGDTSRAWDHVRLIESMARLTAEDRGLLAKVVTVSLAQLAAQASAAVLLNQPASALPKDVEAGLRSLAARDFLREGLKTELAMHCDMRDFFERTFASPRQRPDAPVGGPSTGWDSLDRLIRSVFVMMGFFDANVLVTARYIESLIEVPGRPSGHWNPGADFGELPSWPYLLARIAMPDFTTLFDRQTEMTAWLDLAFFSASLADYRRKHGRYPGALQAISPERVAARGAGASFPAALEPRYAASKSGQGFSLCLLDHGKPRKDRNDVELCIRQGQD